MRHDRGNESNPLWTVEDVSDDGEDTPRPVFVRTRPTPEHPEGEIEADWWVTGQTTNKGTPCYVIAKRVDSQGVRFEVVPATELEALQEQIWTECRNNAQMAGHMAIGSLIVADIGHQLPVTFGGKTDDRPASQPELEVAAVAVDQLRKSVAADHLEQIAGSYLHLIEAGEYDFLAIANAAVDAFDGLQREYPLSVDEAAQLAECIRLLRRMNEAAWMPAATHERECMKVKALLQSLLKQK